MCSPTRSTAVHVARSVLPPAGAAQRVNVFAKTVSRNAGQRASRNVLAPPPVEMGKHVARDRRVAMVIVSMCSPTRSTAVHVARSVLPPAGAAQRVNVFAKTVSRNAEQRASRNVLAPPPVEMGKHVARDRRVAMVIVSMCSPTRSTAVHVARFVLPPAGAAQRVNVFAKTVSRNAGQRASRNALEENKLLSI